MHSGIVFIGVLCLVSFGVQLLPVISVPITGQKVRYAISFSTNNNISFGVFGVCNLETQKCSPVRVGYPLKDSVTEEVPIYQPDIDTISSINLPSGATHLISKLLVVHILAFCFTSLLTVESFIVAIITHINDRNTKKQMKLEMKKAGPLTEDINEEQSLEEEEPLPKKRDITGHLNWMLLFAGLSFLLTLLAFLADLILFIPRLSYLGWIQLLPVLLMTLISSLLCFIKRSILSRRHLEEDYHGNNDMRSRGVHPRWIDDSASDDGFYVYTNGFYEGDDDLEDRFSRRSRSLQDDAHSRSLQDSTPPGAFENDTQSRPTELIELRHMS